MVPMFLARMEKIGGSDGNECARESIFGPPYTKLEFKIKFAFTD